MNIVKLKWLPLALLPFAVYIAGEKLLPSLDIQPIVTTIWFAIVLTLIGGAIGHISKPQPMGDITKFLKNLGLLKYGISLILLAVLSLFIVGSFQLNIFTNQDEVINWFISLGILIPIVHGFLFRFATYHALRNIVNPLTAIIISTLLASLTFGLSPLIIPGFAIAVLTATLYYTSGKLWLSIVYHGIFNIIAYTGTTIINKLLPAPPITVIIAGVILAAIIIAIFANANITNKKQITQPTSETKENYKAIKTNTKAYPAWEEIITGVPQPKRERPIARLPQ